MKRSGGCIWHHAGPKDASLPRRLQRTSRGHVPPRHTDTSLHQTWATAKERTPNSLLSQRSSPALSLFQRFGRLAIMIAAVPSGTRTRRHSPARSATSS
jgi:hypothetical protein